jgi:hypothetical protein
MVKVETVLNTDGTGYWSNVRKSVPVTGLDLGYVNDEGNFGELRVYFDTSIWDINGDGLVYTDNLFLKELRKFLNDIGFAGSDVDYSEQGMQGNDYVSLDVGADFIQSFLK